MSCSFNYPNYKTVDTIGQGTYGTVFLCKRIKDNRKYIIKQIRTNYINEKETQTTNNEITVLSKLNHPNIIKYYESYYDKHSVYIVMEFASEGTLANYLMCKKTLLLETDVLYLFNQILMGLDHIHNRNIVHRDLKCENIFLSKGKTVKIGDFGISKILIECSKAITVIGTPYYLAPELCQNVPYNYKTDMWALGCILYEMCTLHRAFEGINLIGLVTNIMKAKVEPINMKHFSESLWRVIRQLLSADPDNRPSAAELMCYPYLARSIYPTYITNTWHILK